MYGAPVLFDKLFQSFHLYLMNQLFELELRPQETPIVGSAGVSDSIPFAF